MKKRIGTVLKTMTQQQLAESIGYGQPRINQVAKKSPDAWVHFDEQGNITEIEYQKTVFMKKRSDTENANHA